MTKLFSDTPAVVDGVAVNPRWPWSSRYRAEVRATARALSRSDISDADRARQYCKEYAFRHATCPAVAALKFGLWEVISADEAQKARMARRYPGPRL